MPKSGQTRPTRNTLSHEHGVKHRTILVAVNDRKLLDSIDSLLSKDYKLIKVRDGGAALDVIQKMEETEKSNLSLVISDLHMPIMNAVELFKELIPIVPQTLRIILSDPGDKELLLSTANETKFYEFILKPFDPDDLRIRIQHALETFEHLRQIDASRATDELTGLRNRRYLQECINRDIAKVDRDYENWLKYKAKTVPKESDLVFLMVSVDRFKWINNEYGNSAGDMILTQLADILRTVFRETDILVRWGNSEFLLISRFISREEAVDIAERLRWSVESHLFDLGGNNMKAVTCSIGFACYPFLQNYPQQVDWESVAGIADCALDAAKNSGSNTWVGLYSTNKTDPDGIFQAIRENPEKLIEDGELEVKSSFKDKPLHWKKYN